MVVLLLKFRTLSFANSTTAQGFCRELRKKRALSEVQHRDTSGASPDSTYARIRTAEVDLSDEREDLYIEPLHAHFGISGCTPG